MNPEFTAIQRCSNTAITLLARVVDLNSFGQELVSAGFLEQSALSGILSAQGQNSNGAARNLLECVCVQVKENPQKFYEKFMEILDLRPPLHTLRDKIKEEYDTLQNKPTGGKSNSTQSLPQCTGVGFICPCGNCDIWKFLDGNCPDQSSGTFPYLDKQSLKQYEKDMLKTRLEEESKCIKLEFDVLVRNTKRWLTECQHLAFTVADLKDSDPVKGLGVNLENCQSYEDIIKELGRCYCWSWFNFDVLESIIERVSDGKMTEDFEKYKKLFRKFCSERRVYECPTYFAKLNPKLQKPVLVEFPEDVDYTNLLVLKERFQGKLASIIGVRGRDLVLLTYTTGSIVLFYSLPIAVSEKAFPLSPEQWERLRELGVSKCYTYQDPESTDQECQLSVFAAEDKETVDDYIMELSHHIGLKWKALARLGLGFDETDIDAIAHDNVYDFEEQIHQLFRRWKESEGRDASVDKLEFALDAASLTDVKHIMSSFKAKQMAVSSPPPHFAEVYRNATDTDGPSKKRLTNEELRRKRLEALQRPSPSTTEQQATPLTATKTSSSPFPSSSSPFPSSSSPFPSSSSPSFPSPSTSSTSSHISPQPTSSSRSPCQPVASNSEGKLSSPPAACSDSPKYEIGDCVAVKLGYGVVKWIGEIDGVKHTCAGLEMETVVEGGNCGELKGKKYFDCKKGYGLFQPLHVLKRDDRFTASTEEMVTPKKSLSCEVKPVTSTEEYKRSHSIPIDGTLLGHSPKSPPAKEESKMASPSKGEEPMEILGITFPGDLTGRIIGKEGANIKEVEEKTRTKIKILSKKSSSLHENGKAIIAGSKGNCKKALDLILKNVQKQIAALLRVSETILIPEGYCGKVIGTKGSTLHAIEAISGARIKIYQEGLERLLNSGTCTITGSPKQISKAKELIQKAQEGVVYQSPEEILVLALKFLGISLEEQGVD